MNPVEDYSMMAKCIFWLLWLVGLLVALLFLWFVLMTWTEWPLVVWNFAVLLVECYLLYKAENSFLRREKTASGVMLWLGYALVAVPLIAFGGCVLGNWGMRIAG